MLLFVAIGFLLVVIFLLISKMRSMEDAVRKEYEAKLVQWKIEEEKRIRKDAIKRSQSVTTGKVLEHIVPYFPEFKYNPKDVRFIGTPVDFIIFDGLSEGNVRKVVFAEVKTGKSRLSKGETQVKAAVKSGQVCWEEIRWSIPNETLFDDDE